MKLYGIYKKENDQLIGAYEAEEKETSIDFDRNKVDGNSYNRVYLHCHPFAYHKELAVDDVSEILEKEEMHLNDLERLIRNHFNG